MAYEDGNGDLGVIINTEMMILKGAIQVGTFLGGKIASSKLNPLIFLQYMTKLKKDKRISESDFRSFKEFLQASEGDYTIANLPTQDAEKMKAFEDTLYEAGITYYVLPDLDLNDGMRQVAVLNRDIGKWQGVYEAFVSAELTEGGIMSFQELKALTSGQYQIKGIALGDYREDGKKLTDLLGILKERHVNFAVLPDLKYGDYNLQLAIANVDLEKFKAAMQVYVETYAEERKTDPILGESATISEEDYLQTGILSEKEYMDSADPEIKKAMESDKCRKASDVKTESFESALASETETLLPWQHYITINQSLILSQEEDMVFTRIPGTDPPQYMFFDKTQTLDDGRTYAAVLEEKKEYAVYEMNDKNLPHRVGVFSGEEIYSHYDPVTRKIPAAEDKEARKETEVSETVGRKVAKPDHFEDAGYYVIERGKASAGMLQRQFKIGYQDASELMDRLIGAGVIAKTDVSLSKKVLMTKDQFEQYLRSGKQAAPRTDGKGLKIPQMGGKGGLKL